MVLTHLRLKDFRNYSHLRLLPPPGITALVGENGAGKTNILEAIHVCCLGRSHRGISDRDLVRTGCETGAVHAAVKKDSGTDEAGVRLFSRPRQKKLVYINGKTAARIGELMGHLTCVMFSPEDQQIVKGPPLERRRFIDMLLCQSSSGYFFALQRYQAALRQRNAFLKQSRGACDLRQLSAWDEQLAQTGVPVVVGRRRAVEKLAIHAEEHYLHISGKEGESLCISLKTASGKGANAEEALLQALYEARREDLARGQTGPGPHRDDLELTLAGHDLKAFGSQGQTRTAALALRLAQIDLLRQFSGEMPILLLDDVLSELDAGRRAGLLSRMKGIQTLLTCADPGDLKGLRPDCVLKVRDGKVEALQEGDA